MSTDVDPNAEPIKLNVDTSGVISDPNNEGSWFDKTVNKNIDKVLKVTQVVDTVLATAVFGGGVGIAVFGGYALVRHLLKRWDVNVAKLWTDPFGFFGKSAFRSTRYYHYFTQYSQEQSEYLPDPINTYAASAVASNSDIGSYVVNSIQQGKGNGLKRYYQYSTLRFGNRNWQWRLDRAKDVDRSILAINNNLLSATTPMPKRFEIVYQDSEFKPYGISYLSWVKDNYGLDEFDREYQGKQYDVLQPPIQQENGEWAIAEADDGSMLFVQSIPVKPSKGIIYWTTQDKPKNLAIEKNYTHEHLEFKDLPSRYPISESEIGKLTWVDEDYRWTNPYSKKVDEGADPHKENSEHTLSGGLLYSKFVTLLSITEKQRKVKRSSVALTRKENYKVYEYQVTMVASYVGYNEEHFIYVEEDGSTNNPEVADLYNVTKPQQELKSVIASNTSKLFKFYPYIPLREWTKGRYAGYTDLPIVPKEFTNAVKKVNQLSKESAVEDSEANVSKNKKTTEKQKRENARKETNGESVKELQRKLQRGLSSKRKVKVKQIPHMKKPMNESSMKRHINQMAKLLGLDFEYEAVNFTASSYYNTGVYDGGHYVSHLLMPAVNFATNNKETHRYLYSFFNRIYHLYGGQEQVKNWYATVEQANSIQEISINKLEWVNESTMDYGGMSWLFMNKFKMAGNVRKLRRNHRYYDILRGKPIVVNSIKDLKRIVEPLRELANDKYYKSKNGIEYCVGGAKYNGIGVYESGNNVVELLQNFDYTFIARQSGENEISVIAVAGLSFTTKLSELTRWCRAFHDLDLHYQRNVQKYVEGRSNPNASDEIHRRESKKHNHYNVISHWGIIPLDYRSLCKMGGTELERFAQRSLLHYGFIKSEQKGKRKGLKTVAIVGQIIIFIVSLVLALPSGGASLTLNVVAAAIVQSVITAIVVNLVVRFVLVPLLKAIGIKGIVAIIVMIVIAIAAAYAGGQPPNTQSVLPYATEVGKSTAVQVGNQLAQQTVKTTAIETIKQAVAQSVTQAFTTGFAAASTVLSASSQAVNEINSENAVDIQSTMQSDQQEYDKASTALREQQEQLDLYKPNFDVKQVMSELRTRFKMYDPDMFINSNSIPDEYSASYAYLENFINMKLDLNPETFDPVRSLDFSFNS